MLATAFALFVTLWGAPAVGQVVEATGEIELYAGWYFPDGVEDDLTFGIRGGYNFTPRSGFQGGLGSFETDDEGVNFEATFLDFSYLYHVNPDSRGVFTVYGGLGWAWVEAEFLGIRATDDSFTAHLGLGGKLFATPAFYLRPDVRARWFETGNDEIDWEATLGFAFAIGK